MDPLEPFKQEAAELLATVLSEKNIEFELDETAQGNYGPAYERLAHVKGQYDPMNLFRLNSNVKPVG